MPIDVVFRRWIVFLVKSRPDRSRFLTLLIQDKVDTLVKNPNRRRNVMVFVDLGTKKSFMQAKFDREMLAREWSRFDQFDEKPVYGTMVFGSNSDSSIVRHVDCQLQSAAFDSGNSVQEGVCVDRKSTRLNSSHRH